MDDDARKREVERLLQQLSEATTRRAALVAEAQEFAVRIDEIRAAFGNPYFYSGGNREPAEHADESAANYTGFDSHDVLAPTVRGIRQVDRELRRIKERLHELGASVE